MRRGVRLGATVATAFATSVLAAVQVSGQDLGGEVPPSWVAGGFVGWVDPFEPADVAADPDLSLGDPDVSSSDLRERYGADDLVEVWVPDVEPPVVARLRLTTPVLVVGPAREQVTCRVYGALADGIPWEAASPDGDLEPRLDHWFHGSISYTVRSYGYEYEGGGVHRCLTGAPEVAPRREGRGTVTMELTPNGLAGAFTLDDRTWASFAASEQDDATAPEPPATAGPASSTTAAPPTTLSDGKATEQLANGLAGVDWLGIGSGTGGEPLRRLLRDRLIRFDDADGEALLATSRFYEEIGPGGGFDPDDAMTRAFGSRLVVLRDLVYLAALEAPPDLDHDDVLVPVFPTLRAWLPRLLELGFLGRGNRPVLGFESNDDVRDFAAFTAYLVRHDLEAKGWITWLTE